MASVHVTHSDEYTVEQVPDVKDYPDVFPEELLGIPPDRDIEFCIELLLDTQPISIPHTAWLQQN